MRSGAEPPLIQKRSRHAALVSSACFAEAGQPLRPMRQAAAVPFSWAEAPCRKHIYIGARSAVRPDWLRYYSDTGWLWLFLLAAHRASWHALSSTLRWRANNGCLGSPTPGAVASHLRSIRSR